MAVRRGVQIDEEEAGLVQPEGLEDDEDKVYSMLQGIAGLADSGVTISLHRADPKKRSFQGSYLKKYEYSPDMDTETIMEEARDNYASGGNDFCLVARKGGKVLNRAMFSCEPLPGNIAKEEGKQIAAIDPMDALTKALKDTMVIREVKGLMNEPNKGNDNNTLLIAMMNNQAQMFQTILPLLVSKNETKSGGLEDMVKMIEMGVRLGGGQPLQPEGESDSLMGLVKAFAPALGGMLPALMNRPQPVNAGPVAALPAPTTPPVIAANPPEITPEQKKLLAIVEEIKDVMTQPETPENFEYLNEFIERRFPGSTDQMIQATEEIYTNWVSQFSPEFADKKDWFVRYRNHIISTFEEVDEKKEDGTDA